jgi:hypothetical protein
VVEGSVAGLITSLERLGSQELLRNQVEAGVAGREMKRSVAGVIGREPDGGGKLGVGGRESMAGN